MNNKNKMRYTMRFYIFLILVICLVPRVMAEEKSIASTKDFLEFVETLAKEGDISVWSNKDGVVCLSSDINLEKVKLNKIEEFRGKFDGRGFRITNWKASNGLFSKLSEGAVVRCIAQGG